MVSIYVFPDAWFHKSSSSSSSLKTISPQTKQTHRPNRNLVCSCSQGSGGLVGGSSCMAAGDASFIELVLTQIDANVNTYFLKRSGTVVHLSLLAQILSRGEHL